MATAQARVWAPARPSFQPQPLVPCAVALPAPAAAATVAWAAPAVQAASRLAPEAALMARTRLQLNLDQEEGPAQDTAGVEEAPGTAVVAQFESLLAPSSPFLVA